MLSLPGQLDHFEVHDCYLMILYSTRFIFFIQDACFHFSEQTWDCFLMKKLVVFVALVTMFCGCLTSFQHTAVFSDSMIAGTLIPLCLIDIDSPLVLCMSNKPQIVATCKVTVLQHPSSCSATASRAKEKTRDQQVVTMPASELLLRCGDSNMVWSSRLNSS